MSEWRQIKLSVLLHAIDNDHSILLLHAPSGEYPTFRAIEDIPHSLFWGKREHLIIPIAGLRKSLVLAFCYENKFDLVNDTPEPLHRALGYRTKQALIRSGYGTKAPLSFKDIWDGLRKEIKCFLKNASASMR